MFGRKTREKLEVSRTLERQHIQKNEALAKENRRLQRIIDGEHECSEYCVNCKHCISFREVIDTVGIRTRNSVCELERKCKDFERKCHL